MAKLARSLIRNVEMRTARSSPKRADAILNSEPHRVWRAAVLSRAGYRCEKIEAGMRCPVQAPARLFADHIKERRDGGDPFDPANGQCLCGSHHTLKTNQARLRRHGATL